MKVWLLEAGDYSDRCVVGIFSSLEKIEEYKALRGDELPCDMHDPEEIDVDDLIEWKKGPTFRVLIYCEDGRIENLTDPSRVNWVAYDHWRHRERCDISQDLGAKPRYWVTSPISADHAIKVAIEKRQEWLRSKRP